MKVDTMSETNIQIANTGQPDDYFNLNDDLVKFVVYSIISVRRDHERFMNGGTGQVVVTDRMDGDTFMAWKIAEYVQRNECDPEDHPYLRMHYAVVRRWPREPLRFEERQIEAIQAIHHQLQAKS